MDNMDHDVRCLKKVVKLNHPLTHFTGNGIIIRLPSANEVTLKNMGEYMTLTQ